MKTVKVVWHWDDGDEEFLEWWSCNKYPEVEKVKETLLLTFHKNVRHHIVVLNVEFC